MQIVWPVSAGWDSFPPQFGQVTCCSRPDKFQAWSNRRALRELGQDGPHVEAGYSNLGC